MIESKKIELINYLNNNIVADQQTFQAMDLANCHERVADLADLERVILTNRTDMPFIFSDAPVIFTNPFQKNKIHRGVLGLRCTGLVIYFPIGTKHAILLYDSSIYNLKRTKNSIIKINELLDVAQLNKLQLHNASNGVYFSDFQFSKYVKDLWQQEKEKLIDHRGVVVEAPGFNDKKEAMGDIIHSYDRQLPLIPDLSFFRSKISPNCNSRMPPPYRPTFD